MKKLLIVLSLAVATGPAMAAEGGKAAMKTENKAASQSAPVLGQGVMARTASRAHVDARGCLKLATNREIHGCAEKFR